MSRSIWFCALPLAYAAHAQFAPVVVVSDHLSRSVDFITFDADGDGDTDVLTSSAPDSLLVYYVNNGTGAFTDSLHVSELGIYDGPGTMSDDLAALDLDGDGDLDIIQLLMLPSEVHWYINDGSGHFGERTWLLSIGGSHAFRSDLVDMNGDGLTDILLSLPGSIGWLRNTGSSGLELVSTPVQYAGRSASGDMDGDGDPDVVNIRDNAYVEWYTNDGTGNFTGPTPVSTLDDASELHVADLDQDGDNDLLVGRCWGSSDGWRWYVNDGIGSFGAGALIADGCGMAAAVADLDEDMDIDIVLHTSYLTSWLSNNGDGSFAPPQVIAYFDPPDLTWATTVGVADLNGDGHPDVIDSHPQDPGLYVPIQWYGNLLWRAQVRDVDEAAACLVPNPMRDEARVVFAPSCTAPARMWLVDAIGRTCRSWSIDALGNVAIERLGLEAGIYVLHIVDRNKRSYTTRLVLE